MWFQLGVLCVRFVIRTLISWCGPAAGSGGLRESAWHALEGSIRDLAEYRYNVWYTLFVFEFIYGRKIDVN